MFDGQIGCSPYQRNCSVPLPCEGSWRRMPQAPTCQLGVIEAFHQQLDVKNLWLVFWDNCGKDESRELHWPACFCLHRILALSWVSKQCCNMVSSCSAHLGMK